MKYIHKLAWIGVCINLVISLSLIAMLSSESLHAVYSQETIEWLIVSVGVGQALQFVGLFTLSYGQSMSLGFCLLGALPVFPFSLVFLTGIFDSYHAIRFSKFSFVPQNKSAGRSFVYNSYLHKGIYAGGAIALLGCILLWFSTFGGISVLFFSSYFIFIGIVTHNTQYLTLYSDGFSFYPLFARTPVFVPFSEVQKLDEQKRRTTLTVHANGQSNSINIFWVLLNSAQVPQAKELLKESYLQTKWNNSSTL